MNTVYDIYKNIIVNGDFVLSSIEEKIETVYAQDRITAQEREDLIIDVNYKVKDNNIYIEIICNGHDYDPFTNKKEKYLNDFSHDIEEGGFGVTLVETLSKSAKYSYKNGHSHIKIEL